MSNHCLFKVAAILLALTWQNFDPIIATSLQAQDGACEDLSPQCPMLCTPCEEASKWPVGSHEIEAPPPSEPSDEEEGKPETTPENGDGEKVEYQDPEPETPEGNQDEDTETDEVKNPEINEETDSETNAPPPTEPVEEEEKSEVEQVETQDPNPETPEGNQDEDTETNEVENPETDEEKNPDEETGANEPIEADSVAPPEQENQEPGAETADEPAKKRKKRFAATDSDTTTPTTGSSHGGWMHLPSWKLPANKPSWLPGWIPWPKGSGNGDQAKAGEQEAGALEGPPAMPATGGQSPPPGPATNEGCGGLMNGGRQLLEAFCAKSCGACGRRSDPLAAARAFISAQCTMTKGLGTGLALK